MLELIETVKAEQKAREILEGRQREKKKLADWITEEKRKIDAINRILEQATIDGDIKAYQKAKAERADILDSKEMHERRLTMLNNEPLISKGEYEDATKAIYAEIAALDDATKQTLAKLSEEMERTAMELQNSLNKANEVLAFLQHDIYRDADRSRGKNNALLLISSEQKYVDKWETVSWGMSGVKHNKYAEYTGRKVTE